MLRRFMLVSFLFTTSLVAGDFTGEPYPRPQAPQPTARDYFQCTWSRGECRNSCADHNCDGEINRAACPDPHLHWACFYTRRQ